MGRRIDRDLSGLERIVAGLFVLAALADDAAAASWLVRRAMLFLLRRIEARVEAFAGNYAWWMGLPARPVLVAFDGNDPEAARSLAATLRMLALVIRAMAVRLSRFFRFGRPAPAGRNPERRPRSRWQGLSPLATAPDTS
jgi:hypothetical protein